MNHSPKKKITVLIPCHNEESGITEVIKGFPTARLATEGYELNIIVIDNNSISYSWVVIRSC